MDGYLTESIDHRIHNILSYCCAVGTKNYSGAVTVQGDILGAS